MKILMINVSLRPESPVTFPPIGLAYIATALHNNGYQFDLVDLDVQRCGYEVVTKRAREIQYDVVLMGCLVTGYKIIKDLAKLIRRASPQSVIVIGNTVASSIPDHLLRNTETDIAILGEGDETVIELLNLIEHEKDFHNCRGIAFKDGEEVIVKELRPTINDLDDLPLINWDLFDVEKYIKTFGDAVDDSVPIKRDEIRIFSLNTARGCVHKCSFCYHAFRAYKYRRRSSENILDEIEQLMSKYGVNVIFLCDDLTFYSKKQIAEFVALIKKRQLKFYWRASCCAYLFQEDDDVKLAKELCEAGCTSLGFSLESSNSEILKAMGKAHTPEQFLRQAEILQKGGITCFTSLVFGYPMETADTIRDTIDCCIKAGIYPSSGYLLPQPGSWAFDYAVGNGFITDMEEYLMKLGDRQDLRINMTKIPDEELENLLLNEMKRCNKALNVGLTEDKLIKTTRYQKAKM